MDLSAPFIMQVPPFKAVLMKTMPNANVLFDNVTEAATFAETEAWNEKDVASIAKQLAALPKNKSKPRIMVVTQTTVCVGEELTEVRR